MDQLNGRIFLLNILLTSLYIHLSCLLLLKIILTSESRGQSTGVVISITQYFGKFSKIFDALKTHKVVVIVIVFFFHCLSIDVALFLLKLVSHVFALPVLFTIT